MDYRVLNMRVQFFAKHYKGPKFHALLCDPPYHLTSITERFGKGNAAPAQHGTDGLFARASRGFMGKQWDGGDIAFNPDTWAALATHLYPGAFGMAFASSRGWHRMAVAIEDAGLIIHPSIFGWAFGQGFPKATRVPDERFNGHRYGLQAMKPALEPIILFQKPYEGRPIDNITETGAGTLNIDAARIPADRNKVVNDAVGVGYQGGSAGGRREYSGGRWPANLVLDGEAAARLDAQTGTLQSGLMQAGQQRNNPNGYFNAMPLEATNKDTYADAGGASRFFYTYQQDSLESADPLYYCAKAGRSEREAGLRHERRIERADPGALRDGGRESQPRHNTHPTIKPIDLTRWLATLLLPPKEYGPRRILVPFSGAGSEMIGAMQAGWDEITGIEMTREYVDIARARLDFWSRMGVQMPLFRELIA